MKLKASKEEIKKRFELSGEIYYICYALLKSDSDSIDGFMIGEREFMNVLRLDEKTPIIIDSGESNYGKCIFEGFFFEEDMLNVRIFIENKTYGSFREVLSASQVPSEALTTIKDLAEKYLEAIKASDPLGMMINNEDIEAQVEYLANGDKEKAKELYTRWANNYVDKTWGVKLPELEDSFIEKVVNETTDLFLSWLKKGLSIKDAHEKASWDLYCTLDHYRIRL